MMSPTSSGNVLTPDLIRYNEATPHHDVWPCLLQEIMLILIVHLMSRVALGSYACIQPFRQRNQPLVGPTATLFMQYLDGHRLWN